MSVDLTEAIEAARRTKAHSAGKAFDVPGDAVDKFVGIILDVAAPHIVAAARKQAAAEIAESADALMNMTEYWNGYIDGMNQSARIARSGAS